MAQTSIDRWLVQHDPMFNAVAQMGRGSRCVIGEPSANITIGKAAVLLKRLRQIPMEKRCEGDNSRAKNLIGQTIVKIETRGARLAPSVRSDPRPRNRKTIGLDG